MNGSMRKFLLVCFIISMFSANVMNAELNFRPLTANIFEPRMGSFYQFSTKKLRLDIGASFDIFKFKLLDSADTYVGTDFFTYSRLRSEGNFKFPVETADYYFGLNISQKIQIKDLPTFLRIRFAHISSHLVDGYTDNGVFLEKPFVYSREFLETNYAIVLNEFRIYAGLNFVYSRRPKESNPLIPQIGFDYLSKITKNISLTAGYDFKFLGSNGIYVGTSSAQAGLNFYTDKSYGFFVGLFYYNGLSMHGLFNSNFDNYLGIGFNVIFW